tara:strand:+ start:383 stop:610 length:228 start_codon:yes stop_codon:yes gene_type:complete
MSINNDIETVAEILFQATDNISSFKGCIEMAETLKEENPKEFNELLSAELDTNLDDDEFVLTHSFGTLKGMGGLE